MSMVELRLESSSKAHVCLSDSEEQLVGGLWGQGIGGPMLASALSSCVAWGKWLDLS